LGALFYRGRKKENVVGNPEGFDREFKVLVVDADRDSRSNLRKDLHASHYAVITAETVPEAIQLAVTIKPDLILINAGSPLQAPVDLTNRLKNNPLTSKIPLIFMTEHKDSPNIETAFELGTLDFIEFPYRPKELLARIRRALIGRYGRKRVYDHFRQFQTQILYLMSTQIRKHITIISGLAELMEKRIHSGEVKEQLARILGILQNSGDINGLMDDLELAFESTDRFEEIDLFDLIQSEMIKLRFSLGAKNQEGVLEFPGKTGIRIIGNRTFLSLAMRQLILNVHQHVKEGGTIRIRVKNDSETARIEVEDGAPEKFRDERIPVLKKMDGGADDIDGMVGTPIGLIVAGSIIEQYDGGFSMEKPQGTGWAFRVDLPLSPQTTHPGPGEEDLNHREVGISHGEA